jgi:hypothetical protein
MKGDWFLARHLFSDSELSAEQREALTLLACGMIRSGLSSHDWLSLSDESRRIFEDAGERVWTGRMAMLALFIKNPVEAVRIAEGDDAAI